MKFGAVNKKIIKVLKLTDGRDKSLKIIQYLTKLYILSVGQVEKQVGRTKKLQTLVAAFSLTRKVIRLAHFLEPLEQVIDYYPTWLKSVETGDVKNVLNLNFLNAFLSVFNDVCDDVVCLVKVGIFEKSVGSKFENYANYLWFTCTLLDINDQLNSHKRLILESRKEKNLEKNGENLFLCRLTIVKLLADLIFCGFDIAEFSSVPRFQGLMALLSGSIGFYKLWLKTLSQ